MKPKVKIDFIFLFLGRKRNIFMNGCLRQCSESWEEVQYFFREDFRVAGGRLQREKQDVRISSPISIHFLLFLRGVVWGRGGGWVPPLHILTNTYSNHPFSWLWGQLCWELVGCGHGRVVVVGPLGCNHLVQHGHVSHTDLS